jgi:hypothetical protein
MFTILTCVRTLTTATAIGLKLTLKYSKVVNKLSTEFRYITLLWILLLLS